MRNNIIVKDLLKIFGLTPININANTSKIIDVPAIHREGLELAGVELPKHFSKHLVAWGTKENKYLSLFKSNEAKKRISFVLNETTPAILLSMGIDDKIEKMIVEVANKNNIPVIRTEMHLVVIRATIGAYLTQLFAETKSVHASLVIINGVGVMIIGKSGIGKSEAVLELIQMGHSFVSDDTVWLKRIGKDFIGEPSKITKGFLEVRGIGLINVPHIYGVKAIKDSAKVELVIDLKTQSELKDFDRLGNRVLSFEVLGHFIKLMQIPVNEGRSVASLIETATNVHLASKYGFDPIEEMKRRRDE